MSDHLWLKPEMTSSNRKSLTSITCRITFYGSRSSRRHLRCLSPSNFNLNRKWRHQTGNHQQVTCRIMIYDSRPFRRHLRCPSPNNFDRNRKWRHQTGNHQHVTCRIMTYGSRPFRRYLTHPYPNNFDLNRKWTWPISQLWKAGDLDLDLGSGQMLHIRIEHIDYYHCTKFHYDRTRKKFEGQSGSTSKSRDSRTGSDIENPKRQNFLIGF